MVFIDTLIGFFVSLLGVKYLESFQPILRFTAGIFTIVFGFLVMTRSHIFESHCYIKMFKDIDPKSKKSIIIFGLIRGLPLCPVEIGIMLWAASVVNVLYGTLIVFVFSVGTMISLIPFGIGTRGFLTIIERKIGEKMKKVVPIVVGLIMVLIGIMLIY